MSSACREVRPALRAALERLVTLTREGDVAGAEEIVSRIASDLMRDVTVPEAAPLLPPLMDVWFYLRQNRSDLAVEYASQAHAALADRS